tara:strand:+ start:1300 stop:1947 length:648 start_codon:yes stop_codon:yes gene_type:complete
LNKKDILSQITNIKGYEKSLKHDSLEKSKKNNNKPFQKYEFLGDRVLGLIIAEFLVKKFQKNKLDEISRRFIHLVNTNTLSKIFKRFKIDEIFKHQLDPKSNKNSVYADALESLIGFIYENKGLDFTRDIVLSLWKEELNTLPQKDPKTFIQEYSQRKNKIIPTYKLINESGTKHKPKFVVSLKIDNFYVEGDGVSKQKAEIAAAKKMIKIIFEK